MKEQIKQLLEDHHAFDIPHLLNRGREEVLKVVHEIYFKDWGLNDPRYWQAENVGACDGGDLWAIYGKDTSGEWIDANGDCLCFDTEEEANEYIKQTMQ